MFLICTRSARISQALQSLNKASVWIFDKYSARKTELFKSEIFHDLYNRTFDFFLDKRQLLSKSHVFIGCSFESGGSILSCVAMSRWRLWTWEKQSPAWSQLSVILHPVSILHLTAIRGSVNYPIPRRTRYQDCLGTVCNYRQLSDSARTYVCQV